MCVCVCVCVCVSVWERERERERGGLVQLKDRLCVRGHVKLVPSAFPFPLSVGFQFHSHHYTRSKELACQRTDWAIYCKRFVPFSCVYFLNSRYKQRKCCFAFISAAFCLPCCFPSSSSGWRVRFYLIGYYIKSCLLPGTRTRVLRRFIKTWKYTRARAPCMHVCVCEHHKQNRKIFCSYCSSTPQQSLISSQNQ